MKLTLALWFCLASCLLAAVPRTAVSPEALELPGDFRLHVRFSAAAEGRVRLGEAMEIRLARGVDHDVAVEHPMDGNPVVRVWTEGRLVRGPEEAPRLIRRVAREFPEARVDLGADFTLATVFETRGDGTLLAKCLPVGDWSPGAKALFIRGGRLVYDIGWLGAIGGGPKVDDGRKHTAVLHVREGHARLWVDGEPAGERRSFTRVDPPAHVVKVGKAAPDFGGELGNGRLGLIRIWPRALEEADLQRLLQEPHAPMSTAPAFEHQSPQVDHRPLIEPAAGVTVVDAWVQPLEVADHETIVRGWDSRTLEEGRQIYASLCVVCHGTREQPGSLPTALRFAEGAFKNGADPFSMYLTLTHGYGQMVPQGQYTTAQKYSVIHYIREAFLRPHNPGQWAELTSAYLASLPKGTVRGKAEVEDRSPPPYEGMDFGPALFWTFEVAPGNIAQKGLAIRLDPGAGGVSKGRAWMVYDHDTLRLAAVSTGRFVDWKGIAFDGSHGTHTSLAGERVLVTPPGPGWASPTGGWEDARILGRDGRRYGPLPREWGRFRGIHLHGSRVVLEADIGGTRTLESPAWIDYGTTPVFVRTLNVGEARRPLLLRVAPDALQVELRGAGSLRKEGGFWVAELPSGARTRLFISRADPASFVALIRTMDEPMDLEPLTRGGPRRWGGEVITRSEPGREADPFPSDTFPLPVDNPWKSWMRPGGFDFTPDGEGVVLATWNGDIWRVDGVLKPAPSELRWRRLVSGLFQPLGVKFRGQDLFVACRDQIVRLQDRNGDGEPDFLECFNNDHQVTEHFHEFAMGLQVDAIGNFYYAKSGRHALDSVVPHHGTLLRVSADGTRTEILATGFRAANGVCLNPDGTFFVTDQEGFWTPKNRINRVKPGGFYGNMFGYTSVTNTADSAMEPPMVWITNEKDRSPAELVWVPPTAWGNLGGSLLNLSYGTGRAFIVPNEQVDGVWQGAVCELPRPAFETGIMRGRFGPDGALYAAGMFAWAGNATGPGGFHRIRRGTTPAHLPLAIHARTGRLELTLSDPVDPASVTSGAFGFKVWSLRRSAGYGSKHHDERTVPVHAAALGGDGRTLTLDVPGLAPTHSYELVMKLRGVDQTPIERSIHGTLHRLAPR